MIILAKIYASFVWFSQNHSLLPFGQTVHAKITNRQTNAYTLSHSAMIILGNSDNNWIIKWDMIWKCSRWTTQICCQNLS